MIKLNTAPEFERLSIQISDAEMEELEQSILEEGCKDPIVTWNGVIVDGHKRYRICSYEEIEFEVKEIGNLTKEEALGWACQQKVFSIPRRNLAFRYLVGKWYQYTIVINHKKKTGPLKQDEIARYGRSICGTGHSSSIRLAIQLGMHHSTVELDGKLARFMDEIAQKDPLMFDMIMSDKNRLSLNQIQEMAQWSTKRINEERRRINRSRSKKENDPESKTLTVLEQPIVTKIKDMPEYDPDMELRGLILTMPTWMNAMRKARSKTEMNSISDETKKQMVTTLNLFSMQIQQMMEELGHGDE